MGSGDWNDGMNRVGIDGEGESIWLGWFLYAALTDFAGGQRSCGQSRRGRRTFGNGQRALLEALEQHAWDGSWFLRAYYDNGAPLGSVNALECQIDSIAQSWAALSGAATLPGARHEAFRSPRTAGDGSCRRQTRA